MPESLLPTYVDTRKVFLQQEEISGSVALEKLPRFADSLADNQGVINVELRFSTNESNLKVIKGHLSARVEVFCQRCLEPLGIELEEEISLILLEEDSAATKLDPHFDPWISGEYKLVLAELVEEQLLLCMPIVNFHESKNCLNNLDYQNNGIEQTGEQEQVATESPFTVLKELKKSY